MTIAVYWDVKHEIDPKMLMANKCTLRTRKLPLRGLSRSSVVRITDHPEMLKAINK